MKKTWLIVPVSLIVIMAVISYLSASQAEEDLKRSSETETFTDSESYDVYEETGNPKVVFIYSDPTEHHPQG